MRLSHKGKDCKPDSQPPDAPSRHHLPFDKLMALSKTEGPFDRLTVLSEVEGLRCLRSLLPPPSRGQACGVLLHTPQSSLLGALHLNGELGLPRAVDSNV
jgi:hypothetical protein